MTYKMPCDSTRCYALRRGIGAHDGGTDGRGRRGGMGEQIEILFSGGGAGGRPQLPLHAKACPECALVSGCVGMTSMVSRNVVIAGRRTSLRLEQAIWDALEEIAVREGLSVNEVCTRVDRARPERSLTASVRVYVLDYFREAATDAGHLAAGHGEAPSPARGRAASPRDGRHRDPPDRDDR